MSPDAAGSQDPHLPHVRLVAGTSDRRWELRPGLDSSWWSISGALIDLSSADVKSVNPSAALPDWMLPLPSAQNSPETRFASPGDRRVLAQLRLPRGSLDQLSENNPYMPIALPAAATAANTDVIVYAAYGSCWSAELNTSPVVLNLLEVSSNYPSQVRLSPQQQTDSIVIHIVNQTSLEWHRSFRVADYGEMLYEVLDLYALTGVNDIVPPPIYIGPNRGPLCEEKERSLMSLNLHSILGGYELMGNCRNPCPQSCTRRTTSTSQVTTGVKAERPSKKRGR